MKSTILNNFDIRTSQSARKSDTRFKKKVLKKNMSTIKALFFVLLTLVPVELEHI